MKLREEIESSIRKYKSSVESLKEQNKKHIELGLEPSRYVEGSIDSMEYVIVDLESKLQMFIKSDTQ